MSIENLKKILESDIEEIKSYHGCLTGDCPHNNSTDCCLELMNQVHESATNRLLPLLQKAVEMANYYGGENYESCYEDDEMDLNRILDREDVSFDEQDKYFGYAGKKAREFLSEFTKMTEIKKEGL